MNRFFSSILRNGSLPTLARTSLKFRHTYSTNIAVEPRTEDEQQIGDRKEALSKIKPKTKKAKKLGRGPFTKNLFLGVFDEEILTYPQLDKEELEDLEREIKSVDEYLKIENENNSNILTDKLLNGLADLQLLALQTPQISGGRELNVTEACKFQESLSNSKFKDILINNEQYGVQILLKKGSDLQKKKYLNKLIKGEMTSAFCLTEPSVANLNLFKTKATFDKNKNLWYLNGKKSWVINGNNSDILVVLAETKETINVLEESGITVFLVEKNYKGISTTKCDTMHCSTDISHITFENTPVPVENVVGNVNGGRNVMEALGTEARLSVGTLCVTLTKQMINNFIQYCINNTTEMLPLAETDAARATIAQMTENLYAMESMVYLTSKLIDDYDKQDCEMEAALVKIFSSEQCCSLISTCMDFIGNPCVETHHWCWKLYSDALSTKLMYENNNNLKLIVALLGLRHAGVELKDIVQKARNPAFYVGFILKRLWRQRKHVNDNPTLTLQLSQYVHPSAKVAADALEYCVLRLQFATEYLLSNYGNEILNQHMNLNRLADCIIDIYAMTAALGRASRSYCIGLQHSEYEILIASTFCLNAKRRVKTNVLDIFGGPYRTNDQNYRDIARRAVNFKTYYPVHPLCRNY